MGLVGGTLDSIGGGGWGPVGTTTLLSSGRLEPRKVVGSIDTSEFVVAVGGSLGFIWALGSQGIEWSYAAALLVGGVIAAPIAAWLVRHLAARVLGVAAGGLIVLTNSKTIAEALGASGSAVGDDRRPSSRSSGSAASSGPSARSARPVRSRSSRSSWRPPEPGRSALADRAATSGRVNSAIWSSERIDQSDTLDSCVFPPSPTTPCVR